MKSAGQEETKDMNVMIEEQKWDEEQKWKNEKSGWARVTNGIYEKKKKRRGEEEK